MDILIREITALEVIQLHNIYALSAKPDAPKIQFADLGEDEKQKALKMFNLENHFSVIFHTEAMLN